MIKTLCSFLIASSVFVTVAHAQNDSIRMASLITEGERYVKNKVVLWIPKDSLKRSRIEEILDTLNLGIEKANLYIGAPKSWQVFANKPVTFFLSNDDFVPHASAEGFVFMPLTRFRTNKALWFHETMHVVLRTKKGNWNNMPQQVTVEKMPMWFTEGLPEFIAMKLSYENKFARYDAWSDGGYKNVDASCAIKLREEKGEYILKYIGKGGVLLELFGKSRPLYAPTFYSCSCSFTKYLVETYGIEMALNSISAFGEEEQTIEKLTSTKLDELKSGWLKKMGL